MGTPKKKARGVKNLTPKADQVKGGEGIDPNTAQKLAVQALQTSFGGGGIESATQQKFRDPQTAIVRNLKG